jgi:pre-mRNA branch site protein p14
VYDEIADAKQACDKLNGFNFMNRYLVVLYHQPEKMVWRGGSGGGDAGKGDLEERKERLEKVKKEHGID